MVDDSAYSFGRWCAPAKTKDLADARGLGYTPGCWWREYQTLHHHGHWCMMKAWQIGGSPSCSLLITAYFAGTKIFPAMKESYRLYIGTSSQKAHIYAY